MSFQNNKATLAGFTIALGVVFGDIGTSPLYTFSAIIGTQTISKSLILGALSCIIWTLTLQTTIKYILLTLRADNKGEGGIFSLYALIRKTARFATIPAIIGGVALLADGIITPAITISSASEGLKLLPFLHFLPDESIVFIVLIIISILFFIQQFGTDKIGKTFGPVMFLWFLVLALLGTAQLFHNFTALQAFNPYWAYQLLCAHQYSALLILGGVFLCTTGAEALYSDLGHCGRSNIRVSWIFVKACLILNYLGQAAWLLQYEGANLPKNPFYGIMPEWFIWLGILIATSASIIASQSLISGSFTLVSEAVRLNLWPKLKIIYPTEKKGQLYIPAINFILYIGCMGIVLHFKKSAHMEAAYGLAICICMLMTSLLLVIYMYQKKVKLLFILLYSAVYFNLEVAFLSANMTKFFHGGYLTLLIAGLLFIVSYTTLKAKKIKKRYIRNVNIKPYLPLLEKLSKDTYIPKSATHLIYMNRAKSYREVEDKVLYSLLSKTPKKADIYWFVYLRTLDEPYTCEYQVTPLTEGLVYRIDFFLGFRIPPRIDLFVRKVISEMSRNQEINPPTGYEHFLNPKSRVGNYRFVMIEEILSFDSGLKVSERIVMQVNLFIKRLLFSEDKNFGIDASSVIEEKYPLVISPKSMLSPSRRMTQA